MTFLLKNEKTAILSHQILILSNCEHSQEFIDGAEKSQYNYYISKKGGI